MATLRELLSPEELERFQELRRQGLSDELAIRFRDRYARSAANLSFLIEHNRRKASPFYAREVNRLQNERAGLFDYVLKGLDKHNVGFVEGTSRDLAHLVRSAHVDESGEYKGFLKEGTVARESLAEAISEKGVHGFLWDVTKSVVTTPIEGASDILAGRGWGEHPLEFLAKTGSVLPLARAGGSLLSGGLAKSGLRAATRELAPEAQELIKELAKRNASPAQMAEALGGAGFNRARAGELLQKAVQHPAWKMPARGVEAADILGAREEFLSEIVGELMLEGAVAGGRSLYNRADPVASQQERRKADNDAAAAERFQRIQKPKIDAALDASALIFTQITQELAARKTELTPEEIAAISDESFVIAFENQLAPHIQAEIEALEELGLENAGNVLRARMLELHRQARPQEATDDGTDSDTTDTGTPPPVETDGAVPESEQGTLPESAESATETSSQETTETPQEAETVELTPEEIEAQAQADAEALVASANRPNQYQVENALEAAETPVDAAAFIEQFPDTLPQAYRENPRALDLFLSELAADEASRVTATETDGVRQYTAAAAVDTVPDTQKGTETTAYMTDATPYKVRPVIRELDELVPSHDIEGNKTPDYPEDLQPREGRESLTSAAVTRENAGRLVPAQALNFPVQFDTGPPLTSKRYPGRTVAGTGRTNMLKYARDNHPERWQAYQDELRAELEVTGKKSLGIDPAVLEGMDSPVLTYELVENIDEVEVAKDTNISATLDTTGREQAKHDAQTLFDTDTLALWNTDADPDADATEALAPFDAAIMSPANERFRTTLISRIPKNLRPDFLSVNERTKTETLGKNGIERLKDALMYYIFGDSETAQRLIDEGAIEDAPKIKLMLDYVLVDLAYVKARGLDISKELDAAIYRLITFSKRADAAPADEKKEFNKTERMWKEVNTYLTQPLADGGQDSPLERQILYLLYTKRGAEKQLAGHFHEWAVQAVAFLVQQEASMFDADDPAVLSARVFDVVIKKYLEAEAFQIDKDRVNEANPWRTPSNVPPELRDIRREVDAIESPTQQTTTFNAWVENFVQQIRSIDPQGDTDATQETTTDTESGVRNVPGGEGIGTGEQPTGGTPTVDTPDVPGTPDSSGEVAPAQPGGTPTTQPDGTPGVETDLPADDRGAVEDIEAALNATFTGGAVTLETWNASTDADKRSAIQRAQQSLPILERAGTLSPEEADARRAAIEVLQHSIEQQEAQTDVDVEDGSPLPSEEATEVATQTETEPTETQQRGQQPSSGAGIPTDTNQVVGVSRRRQETQETSPVSPLIQGHLDHLGITAEEWIAAKAEDTAESLLQPHTQKTDIASIDAVSDLATDIARSESTATTAASDAESDAASDANEESGNEDEFDDPDLLDDTPSGTLRDITDEQRSDFEAVRRKVFLAGAIARLEAKGQDRSLVETAQLAALKATQRTDAQQAVYEDLLTQFIDSRVARLQAKADRSTTEERILSALVAVQAEGIPVEASDRSLYADLDTPDQEHSSPLAETRTLAGVQSPDTADTEVDLPESVTADTQKLSPAQLTSVKAIIAAFKRKIHTDTDQTVQGGFLLADKPGVGKTRQALAAIWHYMRQGIQKHFILAPNEQILNNYTKDMDAMGGKASDLSNYNSGNRQLKTPIGTATYNEIVSKPNMSKLDRASGNQNALADVIEHLIGVRPTLQQTHPGAFKELSKAWQAIAQTLSPDTQQLLNDENSERADVVNAVVKDLREQAARVQQNRNNTEYVEQFRKRVTPPIADLLLEGTQEQLFGGGSNLHDAVGQLLDFSEMIYAQPDPNFAEAAENFEGVIVLDEMHQTAGISSQTGRVIGTLTNLLPNAKFLYMSATPFKKIENFYVASRLGLWGANQAFPNAQFFRQAFRRASYAVKEVIPLHLKQIGRYISRALSSKETRYTPTDIPLTDTEKQQYDKAVEYTKLVHKAVESMIDGALRTSWGAVLDQAGGFPRYKAKYMRDFYSNTQKFFLALLDAMKAQGLSEQIQEQLKNGDKLIVQLENTWAKTTERAKQRGRSVPGPFDLLIDLAENENLMPVHVHVPEVRVSEKTGKSYTVAIKQMEYRDGKRVPVVDPELKKVQEGLVVALKTIASQLDTEQLAQLPFAADIIHAAAEAAGVASGEISGRAANTESREAQSKAFSETTDLNLIVLGPAGLTGINLPILESIKDKVGSLYHYLVQSSWNVNTFEQGLGRGKRANSAIDPHYIIAHQDLPGSDRVLGATLAKFAEMGALAGQADSALMQNVDKAEGEANIDDDPEAEAPSEDVFDEDAQSEKPYVFGTHGQDAIYQLWVDMWNTGDMTIANALGLPHPEMAGETGLLVAKSVPEVKEFFQRLLHQPTDRQHELYQEFESRLKRIIEYNKELGTLDTGANDLNSTDGQIQDRLTIYTDPDTGQTAEMVKLSAKRKLPRRSWSFLQKVIRQEPGYEHHGGNRFAGIYTDADGHIWAMFENPFTEGSETEYVRWGPRGTPIAGIHQGENRVTETQLAEDFTAVSEPNPQRLWETEDADADTHVDSEMFMVTGMILPKWRDFSTGRRDQLVMGIIPMADGSNLHGRVIPASQVSTVLEQIGGVDPYHFDPENRAEKPPLPEDPNIDIPALVKEIVGEATDTQVRARLEGIVEHIHKKLPLTLRGHLVRSAQEAALLGQLIRDPQVEHVWIVYRREGRIVKIEPMSLNKRGEADAGDFNHIKSEAARLHADAVLRIHNHPSGVAKWSQADKDVAMGWHRELGTLMAEDIIVDSGTFAYRTFENGKYTWHQDVALNPHAADWDTTAAAVSDDAGELKPDDPLYQNPLIRGVREAANYMWNLKRDMNAAELVFVGAKTGKITQTITDTQLRSAADPVAHMEQYVQGNQGQHVHVMMWGDDADTVARAIENVEGVDSVWVGSQRITGMDHTRTPTQQTITREVGGTQQTFIKVGDTLSDPDTPTLKKPVVIMGVQHELVRDEKREDVSLDNRTRGDAEHIVSAKQTLDVSRLDQSALTTARAAIETAVSEKPDTNEDTINALEAEFNEIQAYHNALFAFQGDMVGGTTGEALALIEADPALQTQELKSIFEGVPPETKTFKINAIDKVIAIKDRVMDRKNETRRQLQDEQRNAPKDVSIDKAVVEQIKRIHAELSANETYRRALQELVLLSGRSSVQTALDLIAETPALQTDFVRGLFAGQDPDLELFDVEYTVKISAERDRLYDTQNKLKHQLSQLRDQTDGWDQRAVFDMVEELQSTHRMSVSRIEAGVGKLPEAAQAKINPLLDKVWKHIATERGVYDKVRESGFIRATHKSGDPNINEGLLAYTSYSAYYRRSEGFHNYGFILDMEKLLELPNVTGTVHDRGSWSERTPLESPDDIRQAMETHHDPGDRDIVIEVRIPQDIDLNEYLVGVIEDGQVYVKPEFHRDPNIQDATQKQSLLNRLTGGRLQEYQPSAETPYINRATRAMPTKDTLNLQGKGRTRKWMSPQSKLFTKLRLWTPKLRKQSRMISNAMRSGYGKLSELKAPYDSDKPAPGDIIEDMLDQRMHISQTWTGRARSALMPVIKKLNAQVKKEGRENIGPRRAAVDFDIINFIEYNTPLPDRSKNYQSVATELKETWRKVNQSFVEAMIGLIRDLGHREDIIKTGTRGSVKWGPDPMGEFIWSWDVKDPDGADGAYVTQETLDAIKAAKQANPQQGTLDIAEGFRTYSIAEAFAETDQLWYPHQYDRSRLRDYNRKIEALVKSLNELIAQGDNASEDAFRAAGITKVDGGYKHSRVATIFPDIEAVVKFYTDIRDRTATLLKWMTDGTIGLYPHLERVRETHDRLYRRDTNLLMSTTALLWDRFAEIATFGQIDPYGELPPRLATLIQTVDLYNANDRETALMAVVNGLQEQHRSEESLAEDQRHWGMHESIPAFEGGERAALDIMQMWEDYYLTDDAGNRLPDGQSHYTNDKGERVKGRKVKTGKWKGIDINRLNLDGKTLNTLETIGFIESDGQNGWKVRGKSDAAQQQTIARFFVELMQTKADRRKRIQGLVQSLGHWQQKDPLHEGSDELWRKANTWISIGALGWKQALQNMTEVPAIVMMAGLKSSTGLVKEMRNPTFRGAAEELAQGLKQGVEFLADDNLQEKYLQSAWSMFGWTERTSRMLGVGVGLIHARNLSRELLASQEGSKNRARIEREMRGLRMNPAVISEMTPTEVNTIFDEAIARIKSQDIALAGVELPSKTPAKHRLTDRIGEEWVRAAMYISDSVFKPYDARTLPAEFQKTTPFARMILKFKGWMFQQNRFMVDQYKRAAVEARQGNFRPIARVLTSTLMLTGSVGMAQTMFAMLQGRDENDDELLRAYLHTQTLGLGSVLWEMAVRSEGNLWRLEKTLEGTLVGPVWGTFADVLSPTLTGDVDRSLQEVLQRTPVAREALYIGANRWWEDEE